MFADISFILSHALWICLGMAAVSFLWLLFSFAKNLRKPNIYQSICVFGIVLLSYAALRDIFTYVPLHIGNFRILLPPFDGINLARVGVIACMLCQAVAIFIATMRETEKSKNEARENSIKNVTSENLAKMRRDYLADMSHEMNHPLTVVSVHVQQATRRYAKSGGDDEVISNSLLLAQKEIMNAVHIAKSSLKLATLQIDKEQKEVLEISTFLPNYLEGYRAIIERTGNKLTLNIPENIPHVFVNASQLGQVLMNLLTNAYTHTKNGVITVTVESKAQIDGVGFVTVTVEDNGTGISPELLVQVFERGISSSGGTGLGLPISKDIIESHGGVLNIKSEPNKGVAATFTIPVYNEVTAKDGDGDE
jgi:signal transduction histidine kinase